MSERVQSEQSKFVQHLATYPALTALAGLIASFPVAKIFASNAVPLLHAIHESSKPISEPVIDTATPYLRTLDSVGDGILNKVDEKFPKLQNLQPHEVYEDAQNYFDSIRSKSKEVYDAKVVEPLAKVTNAVEQQYQSVYNTYQKNNQDDMQSEKQRFGLSKIAAEHAGPLLNVYETKLNEKSKDIENPGYIAKLLAILATGKFLTAESYNVVLKHFGSTQNLEEAVEDVKAKAAEFGREFEELQNNRK